MKRREFVYKSGAVCLGGLVGGSLLTSCAKVYYAQCSLVGNRLQIERDEFIDRDYVLIRHEKLPAPVYVLKEGEEFSAVLLLCTHKGCEVAPFGTELHCPCHGSEFTNRGTVINGPAEDPLDQFKVEVNDQYILIS